MRWLVAVLGILLAAPASAGEYLVRDALGVVGDLGRASEVRRITNREFLEAGQLWFGNGFLRGIALFADCGHAWSVGEFVAYLNNTVYLFTPFDEAARAFLDGKGCRARPASRTPDADTYIQAMQDLSAELSRVRFEADHEQLRAMVERGGAPTADGWDRAVGLVAGARLLELETQSKQPPAWRPGQSGAR